MLPQEFTSSLIIRLIQQHPNGMTGNKLLRRMLQRSQTAHMALYLGPGRRLREFLDELSSEGMVDLSTKRDGFTIKPTRALLRQGE
jgi:hypothetical protein